MPTVACSACGQLTRIASERLGQKVDCGSCHSSFEAETEPESWTRFLHRRHATGLVVGIGALVLSVVAAIKVVSTLKHYPSMHDAIFGHDSQALTRYIFWIAIVAVASGIFLIVRWSRAQQRWLLR